MEYLPFVCFLYRQQVEEDTSDIFMERLNLKNDNTEFWRKRLTGEDEHIELLQISGTSSGFTVETDIEDGEEDDDEDDEEVEEENEEIEDLVDDGGEEDELEAPELLALQLLKKKADLAAEEKVFVVLKNHTFPTF